MKIVTKKSTYEKVMAMKRAKSRRPLRPLFLLQILIRILSMFDLIPAKFKYKKHGMEKIGRKEPCLILMNHSSFMDLEIASHIFFPQALRHRHHLRWLCGPADAVAYAPAGLHSHPEICQ